MKKALFTLLVVFSLLALTAGAAFAAPLSDGYLVLREVRNDAGGGVIFIFDVVGEFSNSDFKGSFLTFGGDSKVPLDCKLEGSTLSCTTSRAPAGQNVTLNVGGFVFWTNVPDRGGEETTDTEYCYPVLDLVEEGEGEAWEQFDTHCQDIPANYGDTLIYFSEVFFELMPSSPFCTPSQSGDAFYRVVFCPF